MFRALLFAAFATGCQATTAPVMVAADTDAAQSFEADDVQTPAAEDFGAAEADACGALEPGEHTLVVPGFEDRPVLMVVPEGEGARDAVVMLHGGGQTGAIARHVTRYAAAADARGMVSVFPDGIDGVWRAGSNESIEMEDGIDDVAFLSALSDALAEQVCVDRVLAAGFSNGSMMIQRWACTATGVDAIVAAGGTRVDTEACDQPAVPVLYVHGTDDPVVTYDGSESPETGVAWPSVELTIDRWLDDNAWDGSAPEMFKNGPLTCETYGTDAPVMHCAVEGWGHSWPGGRNMRFAPQYDLTERSLDWFEQVVD